MSYSYINGDYIDIVQSLAVDSDGNLYVTGFYQSTSAVTLRNLDTTASASAYTLPIASTQDAFLIKYNTAGTPASPCLAPVNTWTHVAASYDGTTLWVGSAGRMAPTTPASSLPFITDYSTQIGGTFSRGQITGNLADVRVSNVARYTGSTYTVPTAPFATDSSTLLLLKSLGGQVGTTLEIQGRGLNAVSLGATRSVQSYPPAPMSSYLLDTTSNSSVTYGQGKYVASASTDSSTYEAWRAFDKTVATAWWALNNFNGASPGLYIGGVSTVDVLGNSWPGDWIQIQNPVSILLSSYSMQCASDVNYRQPYRWFILGSRDGINWTLVDQRSGITWSTSQVQAFTVGATQAYTYYRCVVNIINGGTTASIAEWTLNGTEESLCVTSDSKVGVGIANPQRALEVAGDLVVSGTISGGAGLGSFRNRIINGDMRIAQRGAGPTAITFGSGVYQLDRFCVLSAGVSTGGLTQSQQTLVASDTPYQLGFLNSWKMTVTSPLVYSYMQPNHNIEGYNIRDLNWGTSFGSPVTISFWFRANHPTGSLLGVTLRNLNSNYSYVAPFTVTNSGYWQFVSFTVPPPPNGSPWYTDTNAGVNITFGGYQTQSPVMNSWTAANYVGQAGGYNWFAYAGNYIEFTGIQLEKGTVATGFEWRPYATELALCQRYFTQLGGQSVYNVMGSGVAFNSINTNIHVPLPVSLRAPSSATLTSNNVGGFQLQGNVAGTWNSITVTSIALSPGTFNTNSLVVNAGVASGLGQNWTYTLITNNTLLSYIQINNEL